MCGRSVAEQLRRGVGEEVAAEGGDRRRDEGDGRLVVALVEGLGARNCCGRACAAQSAGAGLEPLYGPGGVDVVRVEQVAEAVGPDRLDELLELLVRRAHARPPLGEVRVEIDALGGVQQREVPLLERRVHGGEIRVQLVCRGANRVERDGVRVELARLVEVACLVGRVAARAERIGLVRRELRGALLRGGLLGLLLLLLLLLLLGADDDAAGGLGGLLPAHGVVRDGILKALRLEVQALREGWRRPRGWQVPNACEAGAELCWHDLEVVQLPALHAVVGQRHQGVSCRLIARGRLDPRLSTPFLE
mmetsp:Transcript_8698/g.28643  ORF Transcript_8698/g.28643 Transcript_8698/m.28643 type:complete len:306 (-) Transcript_8698:427-1344(-)